MPPLIYGIIIEKYLYSNIEKNQDYQNPGATEL